MFGDLQRMQKNLHNFFDYSNSMASLWTKYFNVSLEKANDSAQLFMELVENQLQPNPNALNESMEYATDFFQRQILFWDVLRKRGNQYLKHEQEGQPPVLIFPYQILMDGRTFEHPVNYALAEIFHPSGREVDPSLRPYVIVDPRAGHGAGISGFKDKSQVGIALEAGHPVYVVIFFPNPEPNQTLLDVAFAHELFLREVALRHPNSPKPCIIGNCQGGWAALSLVAAHPDVAGVAVINGAPLSYWGGANGKNPMRYIGGILGGSWIAQLAGDLGNGKFDGANLVLNFELSNPQNTYWKKYYKLFANIDTEETRFLNFERWWGGFSLMNANEMRGIIDNLFIGNKLVKGKIPLGESGHNLDLRDIKVPVIVFCSAGDTITPPQQALNWIADLYDNTLDIKLQGQVIVYLIHERIGHLGIFVSGEVAQKEHSHIFDLLKYIEHLAPGLYELKLIEVKEDDTIHYIGHIEERSINDIREKQKDSVEIFNLVRLMSDYNAMSYDFFLSPFIRNLSNEQTANFIRKLHPLRFKQYMISDLNPMISAITEPASFIRKNRRKVANKNTFLAQQQQLSQLITSYWEMFAAQRDSLAEILFNAIYGYIQILTPFDPRREMIIHPKKKNKNEAAQSIITTISEGGRAEATLRILLLLIKIQGYVISVNYPQIIKALLESEDFRGLDASKFKQLVYTQNLIIDYDPELAIQTIPHLLKSAEECQTILYRIETIVHTLSTSPSDKFKAKYLSIKRFLLNYFRS